MKKILLITLFVLLPSLSKQQEISEIQRITENVARNFNQQIQCMAENLYYEAGTESYEGKLAVAQITVNRSRSTKFPNTICEVVHQKINNTYQFSWVGMNVQSENKDRYRWEECLYIARKVLTEHKVHDMIYKTKAMFYHNTSVNPGWNLKYVTKIGNHIFYAEN